MADRSQLSAPGSLANADGITKVVAPLPSEPLAQLAANAGLKPSAERPRLFEYLAKLWQRRHFILTYATARNVSMLKMVSGVSSAIAIFASRPW